LGIRNGIIKDLGADSITLNDGRWCRCAAFLLYIISAQQHQWLSSRVTESVPECIDLLQGSLHQSSTIFLNLILLVSWNYMVVFLLSANFQEKHSKKKKR